MTYMTAHTPPNISVMLLHIPIFYLFAKNNSNIHSSFAMSIIYIRYSIFINFIYLWTSVYFLKIIEKKVCFGPIFQKNKDIIREVKFFR